MKSRNSSLRKRLLVAFLLTTLISLFFTTLFSFLYFFRVIRREAVNNLERNLNVATVIYQDRVDQIAFSCRDLANNQSVQVLTDLSIRSKLSKFLEKQLIKNPALQITVVDSSGTVLSSLLMSDSILQASGEAVPLANNGFIESALKGQPLQGTEQIISEKDGMPLAVSASQPIYRNNRLVGAVFLRNFLDNDPTLVRKISNLLDVQAAIYSENEIVTASHKVPIDAGRYYHMINETDTSSITNLWTKGRLSQFRRISDYHGKPVGVLGIHVSSEKYVRTLLQASAVFIFIMIFFSLAAALVVVFISRSILNPIQDLLNGVNKITNGDLSHEIMINLKDEIGKLSEAFNTMRKTLQEKITTIESMNDSLEDTIHERTETIENLLETMRRYLPSQLYEAIAGGERSNDIRFHYRKKLTIFFSDIVDFTQTTESMEAEDLSDLLNSYLDAMSKIAEKWGGTLDKFVGDAVMIFFGDPEFTSDRDHALKAVRMGLEMLDRMKTLRGEWAQMGIEKPLHIRVGINTGYCTIGNFGSESRMDYTIIGGNVNLASRFESAAQPDTILISHETYSLIETEIQCIYAGEVALKGISKPVRTYQVIGEKEKKSHYTTQIRVNEHGIRLKNSLVEPEKMSPEERQEFIASLSKAIEYARGSIRYVYDKEEHEWRLIDSKNPPPGEG